jgi:anti-anti-sigma factor
MPEVPRPARTADPPPSPLRTGSRVVLDDTSLGVAGTVTGPSGTALLTVTLRTEPPENPAAQALLVVAAAGEVDVDTAPLLHAALADAVDRHAMVCCDLSEVSFLSAAGITALISAHQRAAETGARLTVRGAHGVTRRVLRISGLEQLLGAKQAGHGLPASIGDPPPRPKEHE